MQELENIILYILKVAPDGIIHREKRLVGIIHDVLDILNTSTDNISIDECIKNLKCENEIEIQHIESITGDYKYNKYICIGNPDVNVIPSKNRIKRIVQASCCDTKRTII